MKLFTVLVVTFVISATGISSALATDMYWDLDNNNPGATTGTTASGTWNTSTTNWNLNADGSGANAAWDPTKIAVFSAGNDATGASTISVASTVQATNGLRVEDGEVIIAVGSGTGVVNTAASAIVVESGATLTTNTNARFTTTPGSKLTLNGGTLKSTNPSGAGTFFDEDTEIVMGTGGGTLSYTTANTLNIVQTGTKITGTGSLTKAGAGVLAIASASGNNNYSGGTFVNDGELRMRTVTNTLPTATAMTVNSPGIFNLNGVSTQVGSLSGNGRVGLAGATLTVSGTTGTTFSGVIEVTANAGGGGSTTTGGALTKSGASTLTLTGANTYTGLTTINTSGGAISIGNGGTTGSLVGTGGVTVASGATLIFNRSDAHTYTGLVAGAGGVRIDGGGVFTGNRNGEWTNTGPITVNNGTFKFGNSNFGFASDTPVVINASGILDMNNINDTFGSLAGASLGSVLSPGNLTLAATSGTTTFAGTITYAPASLSTFRKGADSQLTQLSTQILSGNNTLGPVRVNSGTLNMSGNNTIDRGTGIITVAGGTLIMGGTNVITGTTGSIAVSSGTMFVNGNTSTIGATTVSGTGVLGGTGNLTGTTVTASSGGRFAAGLSSANAGNSSTFAVDSLTLNSGSKLQVTLGAPGPPLSLSSSDYGNVTNAGGLIINAGSELAIATANGVAGGGPHTYRVLNYHDSDDISAMMANLAVSTQLGFEPMSPGDIVNNLTDKAIDVTLTVSERNWVQDNVSDVWSTGANWGPLNSQPNAPGVIANFVDTMSTNPPRTVTLDDGNKTVGVMNFNSTSPYTIAGGSNRLILDTWGADAVINVANNLHNMTTPVELKKNTNVTVTNGSDTFEISGIVSGTGGIIKSGAGTLRLLGVNTYAGANTVSAGTLVGNTDSIKGNIANSGAVIFNQGAAGTFAGVISGTGNVTKNGGGRLIMSGANTFNGGFNLNTGTVAAAANAALGATTNVVTIADGFTLTSDSGTARTLTNAFVINGSNFYLGEASGGTGVVTMGGTMNLGGTTRSITVNNPTNTINSLISGSAGVGLIKEGSGQLVLGAATNTYSGPTTVNAGALAVDADGTIGNGTGLVTLAAAGVKLNATASRTSVTANPIANPIDMLADVAITTTSAASTVNLSFTGNITASGGVGTLTFRNDGGDAAADTFDPRFTLGGLTFGRPIDLAAGLNSSVVRLSSFNTTGTTQTFTGDISGTGSFRRSASSAGTGGDTIFSGTNSFSGGLELNDGFVGLGSNTAAGSGTISVNGNNNPGLFAAGAARIVANPIVLLGGMQVKGGDALELSGTVSLGSTTAAVSRTLTVTNTADTTLSGVISNGVPAFAGTLTKAGVGKLILSGANTFTGGFNLSDGSVGLGSDAFGPTITSGPVGTGSITVNTTNNPSVFASGGFRTVANPIVLATGGMQVSGADALDLSGTVSLGASAAATSRTITVTNTAATTLSGIVSDGGAFAGSLIKAGSGTLTATGVNTYTGDTTVQGGTLSITNSYLADAADVYLTSGSLFNLNFGGADTIDSLFINGTSQLMGTWGRSGSMLDLGAEHESPLITGDGLLQVTIFVAPLILAGDYNNNGVVDAADYVKWRKGGPLFNETDNLGTTDAGDLAVWRANFGHTLLGPGGGSGSSLSGSSSVPEPSTLVLLSLVGAGLVGVRRRRG